ncbi:MAG: zinc ribbon domain-containing protein [bacterium]|nr:zinc ribbon domain-containing protein [bacterium]
MGFLRVIDGNELDMDKIRPYWSDAVFLKRSLRVCVDSSLLGNGKKILAAPFQLLVQIREKKVIDVITEAGAYIYHSDLEKNKETEQYAEVLDEYFEKDDAVSALTEIVCINLNSVQITPDQLKEYLNAKEKSVETSNTSFEGGKEGPTAGGPTAGKTIAEGSPQGRTMAEGSPQGRPTAGGYTAGRHGTEGDRTEERTAGGYAAGGYGTEGRAAGGYRTGGRGVEASAAQPVEWICKCGTKNKFSFCKVCGRSKPAKQIRTMHFCRHCGIKQTMEGVKFCPNCGWWVGENEGS